MLNGGQVASVIFCVMYCSGCYAFTPLSDQALTTITRFSNGDSGRVSCQESRCKVDVSVFGKRFTFTGDDAHLTIIPDSIGILPLNSKQLEFVAVVEIMCPETDRSKTPAATCSAGVRIQQGKIVEIEMMEQISHLFRP